jgi:hypothetical protein
MAGPFLAIIRRVAHPVQLAPHLNFRVPGFLRRV